MTLLTKEFMPLATGGSGGRDTLAAREPGSRSLPVSVTLWSWPETCSRRWAPTLEELGWQPHPPTPASITWVRTGHMTAPAAKESGKLSALGTLLPAHVLLLARKVVRFPSADVSPAIIPLGSPRRSMKGRVLCSQLCAQWGQGCLAHSSTHTCHVVSGGQS